MVKSTGIRRKVDDLGRIVIPAGIRRNLGIAEGDVLEVAVDGDAVVLARPVDQCVFCGRSQVPLEPFRGKALCRDCVRSVGQLSRQIDVGTEAVARPRAVPGAPTRDGGEVPRLPPAAAGLRDERVPGFHDERRAGHDPASTTAW